MTKRQNSAAPGSRRSGAKAGRKATPLAPDGASGLPAQHYVLSAECLISMTNELRTALGALIAVPADVVLDATALQRIDTAGLQLLCLFVRERLGQGRRTRWQGVPDVLNQAASLLGLTAELDLGQQEPA